MAPCAGFALLGPENRRHVYLDQLDSVRVRVNRHLGHQTIRRIRPGHFLAVNARVEKEALYFVLGQRLDSPPAGPPSLLRWLYGEKFCSFCASCRRHRRNCRQRCAHHNLSSARGEKKSLNGLRKDGLDKNSAPNVGGCLFSVYTENSPLSAERHNCYPELDPPMRLFNASLYELY